jgi:hypothetical protein
MTTNSAVSSARPRWSMTVDALTGLRARAEQLAGDADRTGGYVSAHVSGEPDAPTLVPNIDGQRLLRQLSGVRGALALARVETDARLAVIGRRVTLEGPDGSRTSYALAIPGDGDLAYGRVSVDSPVGRAIYGSPSGPRWRGQEHRIELRGVSYRLRTVGFPAGWLASVDTVEGPTLGYDRSPYLAVSRAVEPVGGGLVDAMSIVAALRQPTLIPPRASFDSPRSTPLPGLGCHR